MLSEMVRWNIRTYNAALEIIDQSPEIAVVSRASTDDDAEIAVVNAVRHRDFLSYVRANSSSASNDKKARMSYRLDEANAFLEQDPSSGVEGIRIARIAESIAHKILAGNSKCDVSPRVVEELFQRAGRLSPESPDVQAATGMFKILINNDWVNAAPHFLRILGLLRMEDISTVEAETLHGVKKFAFDKLVFYAKNIVH